MTTAPATRAVVDLDTVETPKLGATACVVCAARGGLPLIDLGPMPLVNNLLDGPDDPCPTWPLATTLCPECGHAQLVETAPPDQLFGSYCYFSSQSSTMVEHARRLVDRFVTRGDHVVEIASNDGYLLTAARARGAHVLGVDPAENVAAAARRRGISTRTAFFDRREAVAIRDAHGPSDVVFALNVLAHVPDPHEVIAGIAHLLAPGGHAHIEVPSLARMLEDGTFDTIYHEHRSVFSVSSLRSLLAAHGLAITDLELVPVHGGSLHAVVTKGREAPDVAAWCAEEDAGGLRDGRAASRFRERAQRVQQELCNIVETSGVSAAYGAAAKGVVLLNTLGFDRNVIEWVADISPHKKGRFVPGTQQPIVAAPHLSEERPAACLLLPWNLEREIVEQEAAYLEAGGRFVVAFPRPRLVGTT